jgi:hypothetical protein
VQIREFVDFRDRLQRSFQYKSASTERLLLDLTLETNCHASTEQIVSYIEVYPWKGRRRSYKLHTKSLRPLAKNSYGREDPI